MSWRTDMVERERKRREEEERKERETINLHGKDYREKSLEFLLTRSGGLKVTKRVI